MAETRESIKNRMLKTAAKVWGLPGIEEETSFDPLVEMLINACSAEIEKISRDIDISQARLLEKLSQILIPDAEAEAIPAHTILTAIPVEPVNLITEQQQLSVTIKSNSAKEETKEINFCPTSNFTLLDGEIKFLITKDTIFDIKDNRYKDILANSKPDARIKASTLLIGISLNESIQSLNNLLLYFDIKNDSSKDLFYHCLTLGKWKVGESIQECKPGYSFEVSEEKFDLEPVLQKQFRLEDTIKKQVNLFYKKRFVTLKNIKNRKVDFKKYYSFYLDAFGSNILDKVGNNLLWIEVDFPEVISPTILKDVICSINCFPAFNRKYNSSSHRIHTSLNIIPLKTKEFFFDIKSVTDSNNFQYHLKPTKGATSLEDKEMILRTSGVGRFDKRDATELLHYLIESLRDESASFSMFGVEAISSSISELNKAIYNLEDKISKDSTNGSISYIMIRNKEANKNIFVEFWSTNGAEANNIKPGSIAHSSKGIDLKNNSAYIMIASSGGRDRLSYEEKIGAFKKSLISKGRIVTGEDLKMYCSEYFGKRILKLEVKKGVAPDISRTSGLKRTIDIVLTPNINISTSQEEWNYLFEDLKIKLEENTSNFLPYRFELTKSIAN